MDLIRSYFKAQGFFELETPILVPSPAVEPHLSAFQTWYHSPNGKKRRFFLPTSPELALKKAVAAGFGSVFQLARSFRNREPFNPMHRPEFTMLEWYHVPGDYYTVMDDVENLLHYLASNFSGIPASDKAYWKKPVRRRSVAEIFQQHLSISLERAVNDLNYFRRAAEKHLTTASAQNESFDDLFFKLWLTFIEPELGKSEPEIVFDYPPSMAALAECKTTPPFWAERFELYLQGLEIGNAYTELRNARELRRRWEESNQVRRRAGLAPHPWDPQFAKAVDKLPPCGGIAMGIERLLMALTAIREIGQFFLETHL